jgi:anti-anti-sigma regulatory factor
MPFSIVSEQDRYVLRLEGAVTIQHTQELTAMLGEVLYGNVALTVDTQHLEAIDTSALQLLYSLSKTIPKLSFDAPSVILIRAAERRGLRRQLLGMSESL